MADGQNTSIGIKIFSALLSALLLVLAAPPYDFWPPALVALVPLYFSIRKESMWRAAGMAWLTGTAAIVGACYWWQPLLTDFAHLSTASSLGLTLAICAYQGLVFALWAAACVLLTRKFQVSWLLAGPLCFAVAETAVPFMFKMYLGITVWRAWPLIQIAELGGPPAVSALVVLINLIIAEVLLAIYERRMPGPAIKLGAFVIVLILAAGGIRALHLFYIQREAPRLQVGLVQPNFGVLSPQNRKRNGYRYIRMLRRATLSLSRQNANLIIWPETSWPYLFDRRMQREYPEGHPWELRPGSKGQLLFGALTHTFGGNDVYNSVVLVSDTGVIAGRYDKRWLVPFGEYIPFSEKFPELAKRLRKKLPHWPDIKPARSPQILKDGKLRIGALICSEDTDPDYVHQVAKKNPNLLVSVVSDAWFGNSAAPRQHLALAAFRAVETRRYLARGTNNGVSAIVDAVGRVKLEGPLYQVKIDRPMPATALSDTIALLETFAIGPHTVKYFPYACLTTLVIAILSARIQKRHKRANPANRQKRMQ
jgi:apolipoprotein N-acyltransferase